VAAPRHLRRRRLHKEIPDTLLVPGAIPVSPAPRDPAAGTGATAAGSAETQQAARDQLHRRKRRVAFLVVLFIALSLTALVLALLLG
jgi:hypothetical protein